MNYREDIALAQKMLPEVVEQLHQVKAPYVDFPDGYDSPSTMHFHKGTDESDWDGLSWTSAVTNDGGHWMQRVSIYREGSPWGVQVDRVINSDEVLTHYGIKRNGAVEVMAHSQPGFPGLDQALAQARLLAEVK